jgi:hypothetical protein
MVQKSISLADLLLALISAASALKVPRNLWEDWDYESILRSAGRVHA